jgi:hypothetical protein
VPEPISNLNRGRARSFAEPFAELIGREAEATCNNQDLDRLAGSAKICRI